MKRIKQIARPDLASARRLSPLELNSIAYEERHSVLTPEQLEEMASQTRKAMQAPSSAK